MRFDRVVLKFSNPLSNRSLSCATTDREMKIAIDSNWLVANAFRMG